MTILKKSQFENLKKGQWFANLNGVFEVTAEYSKSSDSIGVAEVIFEHDYKESCHLDRENPYTTFADVKGSEIIG